MSVNGHGGPAADPQFRTWFTDGRAQVCQAVLSDPAGNKPSRDSVLIAIPGEPGLMLAIPPDEADEIADAIKEAALNIRIRQSAEDDSP